MPAAPDLLSAAQAAQWCLLDADPYLEENVEPAVLPAHLDAEGTAQIASEDLLALLVPTELWLQALPSCTDQEFQDAAAQVRGEDPEAAVQPPVPPLPDEAHPAD